jgi:hypothetical protein
MRCNAFLFSQSIKWKKCKKTQLFNLCDVQINTLRVIMVLTKAPDSSQRCDFENAFKNYTKSLS